MTPAELKVRRERLGIEQDALARMAGVSLRQAQRWEETQNPPDYVAALIETLEDNALDFVDAHLAASLPFIQQEKAHGGAQPEVIELMAYPSNETLWAANPDIAPLSARWHRARVGELADELEERGFMVQIVFPPKG